MEPDRPTITFSNHVHWTPYTHVYVSQLCSDRRMLQRSDWEATDRAGVYLEGSASYRKSKQPDEGREECGESGRPGQGERYTGNIRINLVQIYLHKRKRKHKDEYLVAPGREEAEEYLILCGSRWGKIMPSDACWVMHAGWCMLGDV